MPDNPETCWRFILDLKTWNEANESFEPFPAEKYLEDLVHEAYECRASGEPIIIEKARRLLVSYLFCAIELFWLGVKRRNHLISHLVNENAEKELWRIWQLHESYRAKYPNVKPILTHGNVNAKKLERLMFPNGSTVERHYDDGSALRGTGVSYVRMEEASYYRHPSATYGQAKILLQGKPGEPGGLIVMINNSSPSKDWQSIKENIDMREFLEIEGYRARYPYRSKSVNGKRIIGIFFTAMRGKTPEWAEMELATQDPITRDREYLLMQTVYDGRPVFPAYSDAKHYPESIRGTGVNYIPKSILVFGVDCGVQTVHYGGALLQITTSGQIICSREVAPMETTSADEFFPEALAVLNEFAPGVPCIWVGDATIRTRSGVNKLSLQQYVRNEFGIMMIPMPNAINPRISAVNKLLTGTLGEYPQFILDGINCPAIREGFLGAYRWNERTDKAGKTVFGGVPEKSDVSHVMDGLQYAAIEAWNCLKRLNANYERYGNDARTDGRVFAGDVIEATRLSKRVSRGR